MNNSGRSRQGRRPDGSTSMGMATLDELRRRIESLENNHSGIGSEVAVVKAEVGTMQRDINFVRSSVDSLGVKLDTVLTNLTSLQTQSVMNKPRDPIDLIKSVSGIVVSFGVVIAMCVGAVTYISRPPADDDSAVIKALADRLKVEQRYDEARGDPKRK